MLRRVLAGLLTISLAGCGTGGRTAPEENPDRPMSQESAASASDEAGPGSSSAESAPVGTKTIEPASETATTTVEPAAEAAAKPAPKAKAKKKAKAKPKKKKKPAPKPAPTAEPEAAPADAPSPVN